ncbi:MAG: nucleotidyltransferase domain-containing protein [Nanoarchaeota archaeon]|nr:nucleotidyltransferase domain-containing protein [Nanoarchaeota archaeon]
MENILQFLKKDMGNARRIFGERELKIIEKQISGVNLTQSEKNRLSRSIREKLKFIKKISKFENEFDLKKGVGVKRLINETVEEILNDELRNKVKEIWLFGSTSENSRNFSSDIDIAVHFKTKLTQKEAFKFRIRIAGKVSDKIDIQVFEFLPEKIQKTILENHRVIYKNE